MTSASLLISDFVASLVSLSSSRSELSSPSVSGCSPASVSLRFECQVQIQPAQARTRERKWLSECCYFRVEVFGIRRRIVADQLRHLALVRSDSIQPVGTRSRLAADRQPFGGGRRVRW